MPVPIPGPEVGSDSLQVKFLMIFGRPKTGFLDQISGAPGYIPPIPASYQPHSFWRSAESALGSALLLDPPLATACRRLDPVPPSQS